MEKDDKVRDRIATDFPSYDRLLTTEKAENILKTTICVGTQIKNQHTGANIRCLLPRHGQMPLWILKRFQDPRALAVEIDIGELMEAFCVTTFATTALPVPVFSLTKHIMLAPYVGDALPLTVPKGFQLRWLPKSSVGSCVIQICILHLILTTKCGLCHNDLHGGNICLLRSPSMYHWKFNHLFRIKYKKKIVVCTITYRCRYRLSLIDWGNCLFDANTTLFLVPASSSTRSASIATHHIEMAPKNLAATFGQYFKHFHGPPMCTPSLIGECSYMDTLLKFVKKCEGGEVDFGQAGFAISDVDRMCPSVSYDIHEHVELEKVPEGTPLMEDWAEPENTIPENTTVHLEEGRGRKKRKRLVKQLCFNPQDPQSTLLYTYVDNISFKPFGDTFTSFYVGKDTIPPKTSICHQKGALLKPGYVKRLPLHLQKRCIYLKTLDRCLLVHSVPPPFGCGLALALSNTTQPPNVKLRCKNKRIYITTLQAIPSRTPLVVDSLTS